MAQGIDFIFAIAILIMSVVVHEVSHGYAAYMMGDKTAEYEGRLTLNPIRHLDLLGSIVIPIISYIAGGFIIGWAKPVPYNPYNLSNRRWGELLVAVAGIFANICLAIVFGLIIRFGFAYDMLSSSFLHISATVVFINLVLALFNLMPIPPLDGSKILFALFPVFSNRMRFFLDKWGFWLVLVFVFFLWEFVAPLVGVVAHLITGLNFQ